MNRISAQQCREDLVKIFSHQTSRLVSLNTYLLQIKDKIATNDVDALNEVLQQDILPFEELNELEHERHRLLSAYGFDRGNGELEKCIAWCDLDNQVQRQHQQLSEALTQLQHSIQINDLLISKGKSRIRRGLQMLTGQSNLQNTLTYTNSGAAQDSVENRTIARA